MPEWTRDITEFIFLQDDPRPADILFIPGNAFAEPSERAAALYREGFAPLVLPSGRYAITRDAFPGQQSGSRVYPGTFETEWAFMRHILLQNGVPEAAILREDEATYTYQNAILSRRRTDLARLDIRRGIICCMPLHARRAKMYYQTLYPDAELLVCPARHAPITADNWTATAGGIDAVLGELECCGAQFHEILKGFLPRKA